MKSLKFRYLLFYIFLSFEIYSQSYTVYPVAPKVNQADTFFGEIVDDRYRTLETQNEETRKWIISQEKLLTQYKKKELKLFSSIYNYLYSYNYSNYKPLIKKGKNFYFFKYQDFYSSPSLYRQATYLGNSSLIINPQQFATENEILNITNFEVSSNENYLAFALSESGKDWRTIKIRDNEKAKFLDDEIQWVKYSNIKWFKDNFFYWKYDKPKEGYELLEKVKNQKLFCHKINTPQENDTCIFEIPEKELSHSEFELTSDEKYLILYTFKRNERLWEKTILYKNLETNSQFETLLSYPDKKTEYSIIDNIDNKFYILTNYHSKNYKIISYDVNTKDTTEIISENDYLLEQAGIIAHKIIAVYYKDGKFKLNIFDLKGNNLFEKSFNTGYQLSGFQGNNNDTETTFFVSSFYFPADVYKLNLIELSTKLLSEKQITYNYDNFETQFIKYPSKDGTLIPMYLTYKTGTDLQSGNNPVLLFGYGGFGLSLYPHYDAGYLMFINSGGILAAPQIRGGGELGSEWHDAGRKLNKQNTFDDFISAAEYLIHTNVTNPNKIAINGGSTGGLSVGACLTQRPDLFKTAVIEMGVLDMLRYDKYGIAYIHHQEYGSVSDSVEFFNLLKYSPLHNIKVGTKYPATLVITAENDDRVQPFHSYKFIAKLQELSITTNPYLLYLQKKSGHYGPSTLEGKLNVSAFKYSFIFSQLKMKLQKL